MRKICVVVGSRANYGSIKSVMREIDNNPDLTLQTIVSASALLDRYGSVVGLIEQDGFTINERVNMIIEGETPLTMAKSTALGLLELPTVFDRLKPDVVVTVGDRFETIATAIAASYMNIPVAHTMGGEITGTIDESVRHAVTKLSHIHFPANRRAAERIIRMGESPGAVHVVGCPRIDVVAEIAQKHSRSLCTKWLEENGVGGHVDPSRPFLVVMQHPVTTEYGAGEVQITETIIALHKLKIPTIMLWPNADAGSEDIARGIRKYRENYEHDHIRFYKNLPLEVFVPLMMHCACMVGNSSAAIREGAFLGVPVVNIGTRQSGRDRGDNVIDVNHNCDNIINAIQQQIKNGHYPSNSLYGEGHAGEKIAQILAKALLKAQKHLDFTNLPYEYIRNDSGARGIERNSSQKHRSSCRKAAAGLHM